jgi:hypothetical protein
VREACRLHFRHDVGAVNLDCAYIEAEIIGDGAVGAAIDESIQNLLLMGRECRQLLLNLDPLCIAGNVNLPAERNLYSAKQSLRVVWIKSTAPLFIASTATGTSAWPVMTITGQSIPRPLSRRKSSRPVISGIFTSVMTQPAPAVGMASRKALADS